MAEISVLQRNILRLQKNGRTIKAGRDYVQDMEDSQKKAFRQFSGLGFPEVAGYDLLDADTYHKAWSASADAANTTTTAIYTVWDKLVEQTEAMKEGFTSVLDIAYVTSDGIAELWALYKWVGGPSEYIELQRNRDEQLMQKQKNAKKFGPFYLKDVNGSKPPELPKDATNVRLITIEEAMQMDSDDKDFMGTHSILGIAQATWTYYLAGYNGIVPDWRNPLHYPEAVLYWYYDSQIEKIEEISKDFDNSTLGQTRDWLFERGTLVQAWLSGGWEELFNLQQMVDQNYRIAQARMDLIGHNVVANIEGSTFLLPDGEETESETISVLGIKSSKQIVMEKMQKLRMMFPYNAKAYMGPQMWFLMHDMRQKDVNKNLQPYPLLMLEDKISDLNMSALRSYLEMIKQEKIIAAEKAQAEGIPITNEIETANNNYAETIGNIDNLPFIFVEGMMSAFGGRAGPFWSLDADKQFGEYGWLNRDAYAIGDKPDRPHATKLGYNPQNQMAGRVLDNWLTGKIGNMVTQGFAWLGAQPSFNLRGWGYGTRIFSPMDEDGNMKLTNFGSYFDWHPFNGLWCHDGQTHLAGQFATTSSAEKQSIQQEDYAILQSDMQDAYVSDYWNWNDSILVQPKEYYAISEFAHGLSDDFNFMLRKNGRITEFANSGKNLRNTMVSAPVVANTRFTSDGSVLSPPKGTTSSSLLAYDKATGADAPQIATGIFGSYANKSSGLYNLNASPVQSIFAGGVSGNKVKSIWLSTKGKTLNGLPTIGHGTNVMTGPDNMKYAAAFTNYHSIRTTTYHQQALTTDDNKHGDSAGWGGKNYSSYDFTSLYDARTVPAFSNPTANVDAADDGSFPSKAINWLAIDGWSPFGASISIIRPGLGSNQAHGGLREYQRGLIYKVTPPIETYGITGLTPKPGRYNGYGRFPGSHSEPLVALDNQWRNFTALDYSDPLFANVWSDTSQLVGAAGHPDWEAVSAYRSILVPIRKANNALGRVKDAHAGMTAEPDIFDFLNIDGAERTSYIPIASGGIDPFSAAANFNYAKLQSNDIQRVAHLLHQQWSLYPDSHQNVAKAIYAIMNPMSPGLHKSGRPNVFGRSVEERNVWEYRPPNNSLDRVPSQIIGSWSVESIAAALNRTWESNGNEKLINSMVLAEPDNNPLGVWMDLKDPSHNFFGISDLVKLRQNSSMVIDGEQFGIMTEQDLWQFHRALENKDDTLLDNDVIDWFNGKVTKYGWAHIMQGFTPTAMSEMKSPSALPRYWAPMFLPLRQINDFAPRLYYGCELVSKNVYAANPHQIFEVGDSIDGMSIFTKWHNLTPFVKVGETPYQKATFTSSGDVWYSPEYDTGSGVSKRLFIKTSPITEMPNVMGYHAIEKDSNGGTVSITQSASEEGLLQDLFPETLNYAGLGEKYGWKASPYIRQELEGADPLDDEDDDNRLLGAFSITPGDSDGQTQSLNLLGNHWAQQFSWINSGWFGFDSLEEAEMFLANQFKETTVTHEDQSFEWKGLLNGMPTGAVGFGPIDDLIDFVRYFDTLIMEKIDIERIYQSTLRRYENMRVRLEKIAQFDYAMVPATVDDILAGTAKVLQVGDTTPKTYRWLPVFAKVNENDLVLSDKNADIVYQYMESQPDSIMVENYDPDLYPAAAVNPNEFVIGAIVEQQPDNELNENAEWFYSDYIQVQGRTDDLNNNLLECIKNEGYGDAPMDAMLPWVVDGKIGRKSVIVTGGVFQEWEHALTSDKSPLGKFLNKIRNYESVMQNLWGGKVPGFNTSMKDFWDSLEEENTVIQDFLVDLQKTMRYISADHPSTSTAIMNINQKIDDYVVNFDTMTQNWSESIQAMNTYAAYMAETLYSMNQKFDYAIETFAQPYQGFQDVIDDSSSIFNFNRIVEKLDQLFEKNNVMATMLGNKLDFNRFKNKGMGTRLAAKQIIDEINNSGIASIDLGRVTRPIPPSDPQSDSFVYPWLEIPPPPSFDLNLNMDLSTSPNYSESELPSSSNMPDSVARVNKSLIRPTIYNPIEEEDFDALNFNYDVIPDETVIEPDIDALEMAERAGNSIYTAIDEGFNRKITGYGPNDEVVTTYKQETPPTDAQIGDRWIDIETGNEYINAGPQEWKPIVATSLNGPLLFSIQDILKHQ